MNELLLCSRSTQKQAAEPDPCGSRRAVYDDVRERSTTRPLRPLWIGLGVLAGAASAAITL